MKKERWKYKLEPKESGYFIIRLEDYRVLHHSKVYCDPKKESIKSGFATTRFAGWKHYSEELAKSLKMSPMNLNGYL